MEFSLKIDVVDGRLRASQIVPPDASPDVVYEFGDVVVGVWIYTQHQIAPDELEDLVWVTVMAKVG